MWVDVQNRKGGPLTATSTTTAGEFRGRLNACIYAEEEEEESDHESGSSDEAESSYEDSDDDEDE